MAIVDNKAALFNMATLLPYFAFAVERRGCLAEVPANLKALRGPTPRSALIQSNRLSHFVHCGLALVL